MAEKAHESLLSEQSQKRLHETDEELSERRNILAGQEADFREKVVQKEIEIQNLVRENEEKFHQREIELQNQTDDLNQNLRDYEQKIAIQEAQQKSLENKKASLEAEARELADARIKALSAQLEEYKVQHERLSQERASLETQVNAFNEIKNRLNGEAPEQILLRIQALNKKIASLQEERTKVPDEIEKLLAEKQGKIENLTDEVETLKKKHREALAVAASSKISESPG